MNGQKSLMPISPADSFRCYIAPPNHGREFIETNLDIEDCHGVEVHLFGPPDTMVIWMAPLPVSECGPDTVDFFERCIEKLENPELIRQMADKPWIHEQCFCAPRKSVSGKEVMGLAMLFVQEPKYTKQMAKEYLARFGLEGEE